jgi:hypothetical protein
MRRVRASASVGENDATSQHEVAHVIEVIADNVAVANGLHASAAVRAYLRGLLLDLSHRTPPSSILAPGLTE